MVQPYLELSFCEAVENAQTPQNIWYWEHCVPEGQKAYSMTKPIRLEHHPLRPCPKSGRAKGQLLLTVTGSGVGKTTICNLPEVAISRQLMARTPILWTIEFLEIITH